MTTQTHTHLQNHQRLSQSYVRVAEWLCEGQSRSLQIFGVKTGYWNSRAWVSDIFHPVYSTTVSVAGFNFTFWPPGLDQSAVALFFTRPRVHNYPTHSWCLHSLSITHTPTHTHSHTYTRFQFEAWHCNRKIIGPSDWNSAKEVNMFLFSPFLFSHTFFFWEPSARLWGELHHHHHQYCGSKKKNGWTIYNVY